jgi:hypothetical protein
MRRLLRLRFPLALTVAALVQGIALAAGAEYLPRPFLPSPGWVSPVVVALMAAYLALTGVIGLWVCVARLAAWRAGWGAGRRTVDAVAVTGPVKPRESADGPGAPGPDGALAGRRFWRLKLARPDEGARLRASIPWRVVVAACLGVAVLLAGATHLGERSGFWATSVPRWENDPSTADGEVLWLDGQPQQQDSGPFLSGLEVMTGRESADAISGYARSGRTAYPFLVGLAAPVTGVAGSVYGAFVLVNLLLWWGGAVAVCDLTRRAAGSTWAGLVAGIFVATGIGFTFAAGTAMSTAAAYGAVPIVLWVMDRLGVLTARSRLTDDVLTGCLASGAGLLNSLAPFFLVFGAAYYLGRSELRRLLLWAGLVLALGQAWSLWLGWAGRPAESPFFVGNVGAALAMLAGLLALVGLVRLPRRLGEGIVAGAVLGCTGLALLLLRLAPGQVRGAASLAVASLHLPEYIAARVLPMVLGTGSVSWIDALDDLRRGALDWDVLAAFPGPILLLAVLGLPRLPQRWRDWSLAIVISAGLTTFVMDAVTSSPHPRLMYLAYPGIYLLAAHGVANVYRFVADAFPRWRWLPAPVARGVAVAVVLACVVASAVPGQASLWGDWSHDLVFHFRNV